MTRSSPNAEQKTEKIVAPRLFGLLVSLTLHYGRYHLLEIHTLSGRVIMRWKSAMMAPSNSVPLPVLIVVGENAFQMIVSQMFVAMKREIPEPSPYLASPPQQ